MLVRMARVTKPVWTKQNVWVSHCLGSTKCQHHQQGLAENENNLKEKNISYAEKPLKRQAFFYVNGILTNEASQEC